MSPVGNLIFIICCIAIGIAGFMFIAPAVGILMGGSESFVGVAALICIVTVVVAALKS